MAIDEFIASVEDMVARYISIEASIHYMQEKTGQIDRDGVFEEIVYPALRAAMEMARVQLAVPRTGKLTFDEAMQAVAEGKMVTRPGWGILRALRLWEDIGKDVMDWRLRNLDGGSSGNGSPYSPTAEDRAATDWMEYQAPVEGLFDYYGG